MMEKGKLSALQMGILMYPTILATAILIVPAITIRYAHRDSWLSPLWAALGGLLLVFIVDRLNKRYPQMSMIQASEHILGKPLGKVYGFLYFFLYTQDTGFVIREYGEFVVGSFLPSTPLIAVAICMIFTCAVAVRCGVAVLARCGQVFVPFMIFFLLLAFVLLIPDAKIHQLFPMMENGLRSSIRGSFTLTSWFGDFIFLSFLFPMLSDRSKGRTWGFIAVIAVAFTMSITNFFILLLFGEVAANFTYPVMVAARYISLADFIEHMEALVMAVWVMSIFLKICVYYYTLVLVFTQWLAIENFRSTVYPLGILLVPYTLWIAPNLQEMAHFFDVVGAIYMIFMKMLLPLLLLVIAWLCKKEAPPQPSNH
ncbi:spore gernimation protein [Paenibacillus sp. H1-7]|uniref:GerAB/ArcD/ProY family transporter n=1 Tax=Paenibacillus sp. H1-7 TaxID=2282849 RepID=UPI001EF784E1|nr:endospore germination permease [Paenibacillus sp. H1-7]ULL18082.1 spore gernimation protein [Paenibacillus sp. H1-7]